MCVGCDDQIPPASEVMPANALPIPGERLANILAPYDTPEAANHPFLPPFLANILSPSAHKKGDEGRPQFEAADIFRLYGEAYRATHNLTSEQLGVM